MPMKKFLIALGVLLLASVLLVACSGAVPVYW